jgi:uncharacterized membrane protein YcaP (DUF421 family)
MWHAMFVIQIPIAEKVLRTVLVYTVVVVLFRLAGKRGLAGLNTFDFVVIFLLSNVVQNAIIGNDQSLLGGVVGAVTLVAINAALNHALARSNRVAHFLEGRASTVIRDGHLQAGVLRRLAMRAAELDHAVRLQNGDDISEVDNGRLEPSGQLVLTLKSEEQSATKGDIALIEAKLEDIRTSLLALSRERR